MAVSFLQGVLQKLRRVDDQGNGLPVNVIAIGGAIPAGANGSTTITLGGTAQSLFSAVTPGVGFEIMNPDASETLYFREGGAAAIGGSGTMFLLPGSSYTTPDSYKPTGLVSVLAATTGHVVIARSW